MTRGTKYLVGQSILFFLLGVGLYFGLKGDTAGNEMNASQDETHEIQMRMSHQHTSKAERLALMGTLEALKSRDAVSSNDKVVALKKSMDLFAEAVALEPNNAVIRAYRATVQSRVPRFFRDLRVIRRDLSVIEEALSKEPLPDPSPLCEALFRWKQTHSACGTGATTHAH